MVDYSNGSLAIMQPYIFPYLGYFQLIEAVDKIIFYDDVNYQKKGWINRNRILMNGSSFMITIPVKGASQNKLINEISPIIDEKFLSKLNAQLSFSYKKAPFFGEVLELVEKVFSQLESCNISDIAIRSIKEVYNYLGIDFEWDISSVCSPSTKGLYKADRLISICEGLGFKSYINPIGGKEIYSKDYFSKNDIQLNFLKPSIIPYPQFDHEFVPSLSILDVLMFNSKKDVIGKMRKFNLL